MDPKLVLVLTSYELGVISVVWAYCGVSDLEAGDENSRHHSSAAATGYSQMWIVDKLIHNWPENLPNLNSMIYRFREILLD